LNDLLPLIHIYIRMRMRIFYALLSVLLLLLLLLLYLVSSPTKSRKSLGEKKILLRLLLLVGLGQHAMLALEQ
jgi:hypothetical protein